MQTLIWGLITALIALIVWLFGFGAGREDHWAGWTVLLLIAVGIVFFGVLLLGYVFGLVEV
jgi:hypothetical protein